MRRTGRAFISLALLLSAEVLGADVEFSMSADRSKVGVEDVFRVEISIANAPQGSSIQLPSARDFEILGRSESEPMSFSAGPGGAGMITRFEAELSMRRFELGSDNSAAILKPRSKYRPFVVLNCPGDGLKAKRRYLWCEVGAW